MKRPLARSYRLVLGAQCVPSCLPATILFVCGVTCSMATAAPRPLLPAVEAEEGIYTYEPADNGAGPLWCYGATCLVRIGDNVFASGLETIKGAKPLNNTRWLLFKRGADGWHLVQADPSGRTREPCPLAGAADGRLMLSVNPTLTPPDTYNGPAQPQVLEFSATAPQDGYQTHLPAWDGTPAFTEHSYRSFCSNGPSGEFLLFNVLSHEGYHWSFLDRAGKWSHHGFVTFPMGVDYEKPEPIRLCYPELALAGRAAHVLAISDIIEPVKAWREYKLVLNKGRTWDYDFRRLHYTWTPDITTTGFAPWVEIASREKTAGHITNLDIWVDARGRAHLLWLERSLDKNLREKFFPGVPLTESLEHCIVDQGKVVQRTTLAASGAELAGEVPGYARLHATPDGRLFAFYYCSGTDAQRRPVAENRLVEILPDGTHGVPVRVALEHPFTSFMTATERGGSPPSNTLEVLGAADGRPGISYARIGLLNQVLADFGYTVQREAGGARLRLDGSASRAAVGKIASWKWQVDGVPAGGEQVEQAIDHGGLVTVTLTAGDEQGNSHTVTRTVGLPPAPRDFAVSKWGLILRTDAEDFVAQGGGEIQVRNDKLAAADRSLSHWNSKGHWLEWDVNIPVADDYFLLARYATPENATRALTIDGQPQPALRAISSGGYGSANTDNWAYGVLNGEDGKPRAMRLTAGRHRVRLENTDGTGLNLDYLEWVAKTAPAPAGPSVGPPEAPGRVVDDAGYRYVVPLSGTLYPARISGEIKSCYTTNLGPRYPGDGMKDVPPSTLRLFEDGKELGPAHAPHVDIREKGRGLFSHWVTSLYFSASDNSDPRTNGRTYTWVLAP